MVTAATPMPSDSSAAITMGTAVAPLATLARRRTPSLETSFTPSSRSTAVCAAVAIGADQLDLDRVAAELRLQLLRRALDDDLPVVDDRQAPRQPVGLLEVVGGQQDGEPLAGQAGDLLPHVGAGLRVQAGGGLVQEQRPGAVDQPHGHVQLALHATRVGAGLAVGRLGEAEAVQQLVAAPLELAPAHAVELALEGEVLAAGRLRVDPGLLGHAADRLADPLGLAQDVEPGDPRLAAVGPRQGGEDLDGGSSTPTPRPPSSTRSWLARRPPDSAPLRPHLPMTRNSR